MQLKMRQQVNSISYRTPFHANLQNCFSVRRGNRKKMEDNDDSGGEQIQMLPTYTEAMTPPTSSRSGGIAKLGEDLKRERRLAIKLSQLRRGTFK